MVTNYWESDKNQIASCVDKGRFLFYTALCKFSTTKFGRIFSFLGSIAFFGVEVNHEGGYFYDFFQRPTAKRRHDAIPHPFYGLSKSQTADAPRIQRQKVLRLGRCRKNRTQIEYLPFMGYFF